MEKHKKAGNRNTPSQTSTREQHKNYFGPERLDAARALAGKIRGHRLAEGRESSLLGSHLSSPLSQMVLKTWAQSVFPGSLSLSPHPLPRETLML